MQKLDFNSGFQTDMQDYVRNTARHNINSTKTVSKYFHQGQQKLRTFIANHFTHVVSISLTTTTHDYRITSYLSRFACHIQQASKLRTNGGYNLGETSIPIKTWQWHFLKKLVYLFSLQHRKVVDGSAVNTEVQFPNEPHSTQKYQRGLEIFGDFLFGNKFF